MTTENQNQPNPDEGKPAEGTPAEGTPNPNEGKPADLNIAPEGAKPPEEQAPEPAAKFEKTGDVAMDIALEFFGKAGLKPTDPEVLAAQAGDFSLLKAKLAALNKPGWAEHVALAEGSFAAKANAAKETATKVTDAVYGVMGGEAQWKEVQAWARQHATPEEAAEVNAMFKAGPLQAKAAAVYLKTQFEAAGNRASKVGEQAAGDTRGAAPASAAGNALSPREFAAAVADLVRERGSRAVDGAGSPEYRALVARRKAYVAPK